MRTFFKLFLMLNIASDMLFAQCAPQPMVIHPQAPDPCNINRTQRPFPIAYAYLREADVMWSKRIWRKIDLKEKLNLPMYYPVRPQTCLMSLFDVLKCAILEHDLVAFSNPALDDEFLSPMTKEEVRNMLVSWDSTYQRPSLENPDVMENAPLKKEITSEDISQYWIKEDWFFDKQRSVMEVRIIGICPLTVKKNGRR